MENNIDMRNVSDPALLSETESEIINNNPARVGLNIDTCCYLVEPSVYHAAEKLAEDSKSDSDAYKKAAESLGVSESRLRVAAEYELSKPDKLAELLDTLPDGCGFRINPDAEHSPYTLDCVHKTYDENGNALYSVDIDSVAEEQLRQISSKAGDSKIMMCVTPYSRENGVHIPSGEDEEKYIALCNKLIDIMGEDNVVLELGNEMNAVQHENYFNSASFPAEYIKPEAYADWYMNTVSELKSQHSSSDLKFAISGTSFHDTTWLGGVTKAICEADGTDYVDVISSHPYRDSIDNGANIMQNGDVKELRQSYAEQRQEMDDLAERLDAKYVVGEVSFYSGKTCESVDEVELQNYSSKSSDFSYIWLGAALTWEVERSRAVEKMNSELKTQSISSERQKMIDEILPTSNTDSVELNFSR